MTARVPPPPPPPPLLDIERGRDYDYDKLLIAPPLSALQDLPLVREPLGRLGSFGWSSRADEWAHGKRPRVRRS